MTDKKIIRLREIIQNSRRICVFTGAGISCPSGIPDFRSANGLYHSESGYGYAPEEIISHDFLLKNPKIFYDFYKNKMLFPEAKPNEAHRYFAGLEKAGKDVSIVTQNIDGLHTAAGSTKVYEIHGTVLKNHCMKCGKAYSLSDILVKDGIPECSCGAMIRPDVVLYGEALNEDTVDHALDAISAAELLIVVGTSLTVYPAASFIHYFKGDTVALINRDPTPFDNNAEISINDDIINVIRALLTE